MGEQMLFKITFSLTLKVILLKQLSSKRVLDPGREWLSREMDPVELLTSEWRVGDRAGWECLEFGPYSGFRMLFYSTRKASN